MANSLDALRSLSDAANPSGYVQGRVLREEQLAEMKRKLALLADPTSKLTHLTTGVTPFDVAEAEQSLKDDPQFGDVQQKRTADIGLAHDAAALENMPDVTALHDRAQAEKIALEGEKARVTGQYGVAAVEAGTKGKLAEQEAQRQSTQKLLETLGGSGTASGGTSGGIVGPGGSIKPTINASGGVSFTTTQTPALVQRARNQLLDARDKTLVALQEAERLYKGINDQAVSADATPQKESGVGSAIGDIGSYLTGVGAQKYGSASDQAGAGLERLKYTVGIPTAFSKLAQEASFGNIEQMAGQLPGVRGLATIVPLFKEHQSRWGHETPLATVQRLRHMAELMDQTLHTIDTSGASAPDHLEGIQ